LRRIPMKKIFRLALAGLGMMAFGCAQMDLDASEDGVGAPLGVEAEAAEGVEMKAGADVAKLGVASYRVERVDGAANVALQGADGNVVGQLVIYDPEGAMHMELAWQGHEDAFELDLRDGDAPLRIVTDDGVVSIGIDRKGEPTADAASLAVYEAVKPRWDVAAGVFKDLGIEQRRAGLAKSESFTVGGGKPTTAPTSALPETQNAGVLCSWCDNARNCNFLGWSRKYEGYISGNYCVSPGSWCGC